jgi:RNA polymerase primary sigma factor
MLNNQLQNDITRYYKPITDKELELQLVILAKEGSILARNKLLNSQLKAIASIAYKVIKKHRRSDDMINDAINNFDIESGVWFGSYSHTWFNAAISRFAKAQDTIRVPENETLNHMKSMKKVDTSTMDDYDLRMHNIEQESKASTVAHYIASFSTPVGDESKDTLGDMIEDRDSLDIDTMLSNRVLVDDLLNNPNNTEIENKILNFMYKHDCVYTFKDMAESIGYTKQYLNIKLKKLSERLTGTYYETERT